MQNKADIKKEKRALKLRDIAPKKDAKGGRGIVLAAKKMPAGGP